MDSHRLTIAVGILVVGAFFTSVGLRVLRAQARYVDQTYAPGSPWSKMEAKAKAENPTDANSVRELMDEVLGAPHSVGLIPPVMREILEDRLMQAEINFKLGRSLGVQEKSLVQIGDMLVEKLGLPDYARTSVHQVQVLRFGMEMNMPSFMGVAEPKHSEADSDRGQSENGRELSPAQATHILLTLFDQKLINPDYQVTPDEWEQTQYQPAMERMRKYKELRDSGQLENTVKRGALVAMTHTRDLRTIISQQVSQMSITDGLDMVDRTFKIAGINK